LVIDESTAVSQAQAEISNQRKGFWLTGSLIYLFWNLATLLGAWLGDSIGDPTVWGLDAAAAAAFLGLVWPRLKGLTNLLTAASAVVIATLMSPLVPPGVSILLAGSVAFIFGWRHR
jgi:predicted branched-subunit amino acid permease